MHVLEVGNNVLIWSSVLQWNLWSRNVFIIKFKKCNKYETKHYIYVILINLLKVHTDLSMNSSFKNIKILDENCDYFWLQRSQVFLTNTQAETPQGRKTALGHYPASREEVCIAKTTVPKKGLIKLTALDNELKNPLLFDKKEKEGWLGYSWKVRFNRNFFVDSECVNWCLEKAMINRTMLCGCP